MFFSWNPEPSWHNKHSNVDHWMNFGAQWLKHSAGWYRLAHSWRNSTGVTPNSKSIDVTPGASCQKTITAMNLTSYSKKKKEMLAQAIRSPLGCSSLFWRHMSLCLIHQDIFMGIKGFFVYWGSLPWRKRRGASLTFPICHDEASSLAAVFVTVLRVASMFYHVFSYWVIPQTNPLPSHTAPLQAGGKQAESEAVTSIVAKTFIFLKPLYFCELKNGCQWWRQLMASEKEP